MAKGRSAVLTEQQAAVVDAVMLGTPLAHASSNPTQTLRSETVKAELVKARAEVSNLTTLKRLDVIEGIMDGISTAKFMSDGGNIIRGWCEIAKILGHYAPEVKKVEITVGQARLRTQYEALSDEQLLAIARGDAIEGEYTVE